MDERVGTLFDQGSREATRLAMARGAKGEGRNYMHFLSCGNGGDVATRIGGSSAGSLPSRNGWIVNAQHARAMLLVLKVQVRKTPHSAPSFQPVNGGLCASVPS
eukprot:4854436-Pleurochrysis_carterae.AAC.1